MFEKERNRDSMSKRRLKKENNKEKDEKSEIRKGGVSKRIRDRLKNMEKEEQKGYIIYT